jgi:hypothetical protein
MTDRAYPISDPRSPDYDGTPLTQMVAATSRDLPIGHPRANDNPKRDNRPEEAVAWVCAFNPPQMHSTGTTHPVPPGQPTGQVPVAVTATQAE